MGFFLPCFSCLLWHKAYHRRVRKSTKDFWYRISFFRVASYCYKHLKNTSDTAENTTWMAQPSHKLSHFHQNSTTTPFSAPPRTALPVGVWPHWWRLTTPMLFPASFYFFYFSFKSVSFQFGDFIIFIVILLLFSHFLRCFCQEQRVFLSRWIFPSLFFSFPISTVLLLRPTHRINFKVSP